MEIQAFKTQLIYSKNMFNFFFNSFTNRNLINKTWAKWQNTLLLMIQIRFLLDGNPLQIFSGEMHYQRIPRECWEQRIQMAKAMGLNTITIYMFWNAHEPLPGTFDFSEMNDVGELARLIQAAGLWVIVRPGPYCCAEWDFGGLPPWLLTKDNLRVRCMDSQYLEAVEGYIRRWSQELVPLQCTQGGPILMVAVENEYGSYGRDKDYLTHLKDLLREVGFDVPFFTCDGFSPEMLSGGTLPDILCGVNFGSHPAMAFEKLTQFRPDIPHMCFEYYPGWFNHWGNKLMVRQNPIKLKMILQDLEWMITHNKSWSLYMFHGGTSWGFYPGANHGKDYQPDITSYDYAAPLDETGRPTSYYFAIRDLLLKHHLQGDPIPDVPTIPECNSISPIQFSQSLNLLNLPYNLLNRHKFIQWNIMA